MDSKQVVFVVDSITKSIKELKEELLIRLIRVENKVKEIDSRLSVLESSQTKLR